MEWWGQGEGGGQLRVELWGEAGSGGGQGEDGRVRMGVVGDRGV